MPLIFPSSDTIPPLLSLIQPQPTTSLFSFTILFTTSSTLKMFPSLCFFSHISPKFLHASFFALQITIFASFFAALYATLSASDFDFLNALNFFLFTSTASETPSFHHHVSLCLLGFPFVFSHTLFAASVIESFKHFQISSTEAVSSSTFPAIFLSTSNLNFSLTSHFLSFHNIVLGIVLSCFLFTLSSITTLHINSLCWGKISSPS